MLSEHAKDSQCLLVSCLFLQMRSSRTCLLASQPMEMPASQSQWRSMAQSTQVCVCGEGLLYYISLININNVLNTSLPSLQPNSNLEVSNIRNF